MERVNGFCYWEDKLDARGGCVAAVTATVKIDWVKLKECEELLLGTSFPLQMKGKDYTGLRLNFFLQRLKVFSWFRIIISRRIQICNQFCYIRSSYLAMVILIFLRIYDKTAI